MYDAGDVVAASGDDAEALRGTHGRVTEAAAWLLERGMFVVGIGGGHDLTFPLVRAVSRKFGTMGGMYFDAHLDVRETAGSGMAFRRLIEECGTRPLIVRGLSPYVNSAEHVEWFKANGGKIDGWGPGRFDGMPRAVDQFFASFDLDVLDASIAPGVSALNPCGWDVQAADKAIGAIASDPRLRCFDFMELNPTHDEQGRTARVCVRLFLALMRGVAERFGKEGMNAEGAEEAEEREEGDEGEDS